MSAMFTDSEIGALRRAVMAIRKAGIVSRRDLAHRMNVNPTHLDNFISPKRDKKKEIVYRNGEVLYKSQSPSNSRLLYPIYSFLVTYAPEAALSDCPGLSDVIDEIRSWKKAISSNTAAHDDHLFEHFRSEGVYTAETARSVSDAFTGRYNTYRISSDGREIVRSITRVRAFDAKEKTPRFTNEYENRFHERRVTIGNIFDLGKCLHFVGFIKSGTRQNRRWPGQKIMIINKPSLAKISHMYGIFMSMDREASYDLGKVVLVKESSDRFDHNERFYIPIEEFANKSQFGMEVLRNLTLSARDLKGNYAIRASIVGLI